MTAVEAAPYYLTVSDLGSCFYARDYVSRGGHKASEANHLVSNLKKPISKKGLPEWHYKERAISQFAGELAEWLGTLDEGFCIAPIPSSKRRDHAEFDNRIEQVIKQFCQRCPRVSNPMLIERRLTMLPAHLSNNRHTIEEIYQSLAWNGLQASSSSVILVDDVITTGASFRACQRMIKEQLPDVNVYGVFWARTIWPESQVDLSGLGIS